jgi:hypothetical protein
LSLIPYAYISATRFKDPQIFRNNEDIKCDRATTGFEAMKEVGRKRRTKLTL